MGEEDCFSEEWNNVKSLAKVASSATLMYIGSVWIYFTMIIPEIEAEGLMNSVLMPQLLKLAGGIMVFVAVTIAMAWIFILAKLAALFVLSIEGIAVDVFREYFRIIHTLLHGEKPETSRGERP